MGQEIAPNPADVIDKPHILLGGKGYSWLRWLRKKSPDLFSSFLVSILYSKKGMPRPSPSDVLSGEIKTFESLTRDSVPIFDKIRADPDIKELVFQLRRTTKAIFHKCTSPYDVPIVPFFPSTSANYINSNAMGGAVGVIMNHPDLLVGLRDDSELVQFSEIKSDETIDSVSGISVDDQPLVDKFNLLFNRIREKSALEEPIAVPLGLPEALKVRVITKGPPLRQTLLKPLQSFMWKRLSSFPCFKLLSSPIPTEELFQSIFKCPGKFLSVDYSDATNQLFSWCSNIVALEICECLNLDLDISQFFIESLTYHLLELKTKGKPLLRKLQTNGQLMGSITSFPILCIINAAICRMVLEIDHKKKYPLREVPLLVNGDDGLFCVSDNGRLLWSKFSTLCGLLPSVGKVYHSCTYLNINSYSFSVSENSYKVIPYINMGLMKNVKRSGTADASKTFMSIGAKCTKLVLSSPSALQERVLGQYIHKNLDFLKKVGVPWFLPEYLHGLGLPTIGSFQPAEYNLRFLDQASLMKPVRRPRSAWQCWDYATSRLPELAKALAQSLRIMSKVELASFSNDSDFSLDDVKGKLCVEALFRCPHISKLYIDPKKGELVASESCFYRTLRRNWQLILQNNHSKKLPPVLSLSDFPDPIKVGSTRLLHRLGNSFVPLQCSNNLFLGGLDDIFMPS
jgi:hypothetical protein